MEKLTVNFNDDLAISGELIEKINQVCRQVENDSSIKQLTLAFETASVNEQTSQVADPDLLHKWEKALRRVENLDALIVARAETACGLVALSMIAIADLRVGTPGSTFSLRGKDLTLPGMLIHRLTRQLSDQWVRSLLILGNTLSADEAVTCGLLDRVSTQPAALAEDMVMSMNSFVFNDIRVRRKLILEASHTSYDDTIGLSLSASDRAIRKG